MNLVQETRVFSDALGRLPLPAGVSHVYNPLAYMRRAHERYLERFVPGTYEDVIAGEYTGAPAPRPYLILGMNPGPWGMVQTGVPFGDVATARSLLLYDTPPEPELERVKLHPNRPVLGLASARREASGERLWGGLSQVWAGGSVDVLRDAFAMNYCPLAYFAGDEQGTNVTPDAFVKSGPYRDREYAEMAQSTMKAAGVLPGRFS